MKKILIVAMANSIHTARWLNQLADSNFEIFLYSSNGYVIPHADINARIHLLNFNKHLFFLRKLKLTILLRIICKFIRVYENFFLDRHPEQLASLIDKISPNLIHSLEFQSAAYLVMDSKKIIKGKFPNWWATCWGSDINHFKQFKNHKDKIKKVLGQCDYYSCECDRDYDLASELGLKGKFLGLVPSGGGFYLSQLEPSRLKKPSDRRLIMIKGYQGWSGRALAALSALEKCKDLLSNYEVCIYAASDSVIKVAKQIMHKTRIRIRIVPWGTSHFEILKFHSRSRVSIGIGIADGISTSMLEAMIAGSCPIQSSSACADEWIVKSKNGFIVDPEDIDQIYNALRQGLLDDQFVNSAAEMNWSIAKRRLDYKLIKAKVSGMYNLALHN
jgi:glycosyltransferase involved in cell wall biosynthesis